MGGGGGGGEKQCNVYYGSIIPRISLIKIDYRKFNVSSSFLCSAINVNF